jgi:acetyltransferase
LQSVNEIPGQVDLVIILIPANLVPSALVASAAKGAAAAVICSGGFREAGREDLETELRRVSQEYDIRLLGPNIAGITYVPNKLCAVFYPAITKQGPVTVISQSGTITNSIAEWAADEGLGISAAINLGNQIDICEADFLDFFVTDENTKVLALYIEGVKDGRRFFNSLKRTTAQKPVVILKGGKTAVGQSSASSHTGSLAADYQVFKAACRQCGAILARDLESLYDQAKCLATMRLPKGNRVFSISSSGGACTLAADTLDECGLLMPQLDKGVVEAMKEIPVSHLANFSNPFDSGADLDVDHFREVALLADKFHFSDVTFFNFGDPMVGATKMVIEIAQKINTSIVISYFGGGKEEKIGRVQMHEAGFPVFPTPERAIRGIGAAMSYARLREIRRLEHDEESVETIETAIIGKENCRLVPEYQAIDVINKYRIPFPEHGLAKNPDEAVRIAGQIDAPFVLKIVSPDVVHKTDVGGVLVGLNSPEQALGGYKLLVERLAKAMPHARIEGILVCRQAEEGLEVIVGGFNDSVFGPTIMFGMGGIFTEYIRDVAFRVAPVTKHQAGEMIKEIRSYPILQGVRGRPGIDIRSLRKLLQSVSRLMIERKDICELDLNPVRLYASGLAALDVRILRRNG